MRWYQVENLKEVDFRRLTGVKRTTFNSMLDILKKDSAERRIHGGRNRKLIIEDILLMALEYIREYRTYFHISKSYGISESSAYKAIKWVEDTLIKHPDFSLPGRKELLKSDLKYEVICIDATETPIERPKKTKKLLFRQKEKTHIKKSNCDR